jgi:uncharacterized protein YeaO (DUF488 family)
MSKRAKEAPRKPGARKADGASKPAAAKGDGAKIAIKRAYDEPEAGDGLRILIDRLWPRGKKKGSLKIDLWPKHLAPSDELRRWYHADDRPFDEFRRHYLAELKANGESLAELRTLLRGRSVTLITAVREPERSHAAVLAEALVG